MGKYSCLNNYCVESQDGRYDNSNCDGKCNQQNNDQTNCNTMVTSHRNAGWEHTNETNYNNAKSKGIYDLKIETCGDKTYYFYKRKPNQQTPGQSGNYIDCKNTFNRGCKDLGSTLGNPNKDGLIYKVQGCLGVKQDSFFGSKTEAALFGKTNKKFFTNNDVATICDGSTSGNVGPTIELPLSQTQKEQYWNDLIAKDRIYDQGLIYTLSDNTVVYIVKTELNNPEVKLTLKTLKGEDLTKNDYIVMYPIKRGDIRGKFGLLVKYKKPNGTEGTKIEKGARWSWSPEEEVESVDMFESKITNILKNVLLEQTFHGRLTTPTQPGGTTTNSGTQQNPETTTSTPSNQTSLINTQASNLSTQQTTQGSGSQPEQTQEEPKELDATKCRDLVIQYLYGAFTASNMESVGSEMAKGKILDPKTIKNRLCGCYKLGDLNDIEISKEDFTSGNYRLNPKFLNFRFLNKSLKWPEIKKLIQTGKNKGFELGRGYIDNTFGEKDMCIGQTNESIKKIVKNKISEAINKKKKLTENIVNKITKKLI